MTFPNFFKKLLLPAFCLFLLINNTWSQENQPTSTTRFPNQIGLDFAPFVRGQQGLGLIYKHKIGRVKVKKWQKQSALRAVAGFYKDPIDPYNFPYHRGDTTFVHDGGGDANRYFISVGMERQLDRKKFRFYFGGDIGYRGSTYKSTTYINATVNNTTFLYDSYGGDVISNAPIVSAFVGCNYFILPRLSVGVEAQIAFSIDFSTSKIIRDGQAGTPYKSTVFEGANDLLRFLYLSYHF